jgi:hypothetical protein
MPMIPVLVVGEDDEQGTLSARYPVLDMAEAALENGDTAEAAAICLRGLAVGRLPVFVAANLVRLLHGAGAPEALALEAALIAQVRARADQRPDDLRLQFVLGPFCAALARPRRPRRCLSPRCGTTPRTARG